MLMANTFIFHDVKFFAPKIHSIECLAYNDKTDKLALSRSNGTIELWNINANWFQEAIIQPTFDPSIEALLWCNNNLFSAGLHCNLIHYDLKNLSIKSVEPSNAGPVWCLTKSADDLNIVAGTEDGCLVLFEFANDSLTFTKFFERVEGRILCVSWNSRSKIIAAGGLNNIFIWNSENYRILHRLAMPRLNKQISTIVWDIKITADCTIISVDSRGKVSFWNALFGSQIMTYQAHSADTLCLAVNKAGDYVICAGIDPRFREYQRIVSSDSGDLSSVNFRNINDDKSSRTLKSSHLPHQKEWTHCDGGKFSLARLFHTHDVRTICWIEKLNMIVSGGVDCNLIVNTYRSRTYQNVRNLRIPPISHHPKIQVASKAPVLLLNYESHLELWRLATSQKEAASSSPLKLLSISSTADTNVSSSSISQSTGRPISEKHLSIVDHDSKNWADDNDNNNLNLFEMSLVKNNDDDDDIILPTEKKTNHESMNDNTSNGIIANAILSDDGTHIAYTIRRCVIRAAQLCGLINSGTGDWQPLSQKDSPMSPSVKSTFAFRPIRMPEVMGTIHSMKFSHPEHLVENNNSSRVKYMAIATTLGDKDLGDKSRKSRSSEKTMQIHLYLITFDTIMPSPFSSSDSGCSVDGVGTLFPTTHVLEFDCEKEIRSHFGNDVVEVSYPHLLEFNIDSSRLAMAFVTGHIFIYSVPNLQLYSILPHQSSHVPMCLAFHPVDVSLLLIAFSTRIIHEFNIDGIMTKEDKKVLISATSSTNDRGSDISKSSDTLLRGSKSSSSSFDQTYRVAAYSEWSHKIMDSSFSSKSSSGTSMTNFFPRDWCNDIAKFNFLSYLKSNSHKSNYQRCKDDGKKNCSGDGDDDGGYSKILVGDHHIIAVIDKRKNFRAGLADKKSQCYFQPVRQHPSFKIITRPKEVILGMGIFNISNVSPPFKNRKHRKRKRMDGNGSIINCTDNSTVTATNTTTTPVQNADDDIDGKNNITSNHLVLVEQSRQQILDSLPPRFSRKVFGV